MKKAKKEFDAVGTMREIRDRLSNSVEGMTFEEEKLFIQKHLAQSKPHPPHQQAHPASQPTRQPATVRKPGQATDRTR